MPQLSEKESIILTQISTKSPPSQRSLSKATGISLGLINVILKRLVTTGYVKVSRLNKRKLEYLLTSQGLTETARRSCQFTLNTIRGYRSIQVGLSNLLKELHKSGYDYFSIHGDGELKELVESTFYKCLEDAPVTLGKGHRQDPRAVVLNISADPVDPGFIKGNVINVLEKIAT